MIFAYRRPVEIEILYFEPRLLRRALAVHRIEMPVDRSAVIEMFVAQHIEAMLADSFRASDNFFGLSGKILLQRRKQ